MTGDRYIKLDDGNYNERVERNVIHAQQVTIVEKVENLVTNKKDVSSHESTTQKRLAFAIAGSIEEVDQAKLKVIAALLQEISGDTSIKIIAMQEGSIRLILEGSQEGLEKLKELFESGELTKVDDIPVEYVRFLDTEISDDDAKIETYEKFRLVEEIRTQYKFRRNLRGADLSSANLSGADLSSAYLSGADLSSAYLSGADLRDADLIRTDLSGADLSGADLRDANLRGANLSGANLSGAYLSGAYLRNTKIDEKTKLGHKWRKVWAIVNQGAKGQDLSGTDLSGTELSDTDLRGANLIRADLSNARLVQTNLSSANLIRANLSGADLSNSQLLAANLTDVDLSGAKVKNTHFGYNSGISDYLKRDLIARGAIFEDSSGNPSKVLVPV